MKKGLCMLMCAVMLLAMPMTAFAHTEYGGGESPYYGEGETMISARVYSSCVVSIPATIDIYDYTTPTTAEIRISNANIAAGESIRVRIRNLDENNAIVLTNTADDPTFGVTFTTENGAEITRDNPYLAIIRDINQDGTAWTSFNMQFQGDMSGAKAGIYEGRMQYEITIDGAM